MVLNSAMRAVKQSKLAALLIVKPLRFVLSLPQVKLI